MFSFVLRKNKGIIIYYLCLAIWLSPNCYSMQNKLYYVIKNSKRNFIFSNYVDFCLKLYFFFCSSFGVKAIVLINECKDDDDDVVVLVVVLGGLLLLLFGLRCCRL